MSEKAKRPINASGNFQVFVAGAVSVAESIEFLNLLQEKFHISSRRGATLVEHFTKTTPVVRGEVIFTGTKEIAEARMSRAEAKQKQCKILKGIYFYQGMS